MNITIFISMIIYTYIYIYIYAYMTYHDDHDKTTIVIIRNKC